MSLAALSTMTGPSYPAPANQSVGGQLVRSAASWVLTATNSTPSGGPPASSQLTISGSSASQAGHQEARNEIIWAPSPSVTGVPSKSAPVTTGAAWPSAGSVSPSGSGGRASPSICGSPASVSTVTSSLSEVSSTESTAIKIATSTTTAPTPA